MSTHTPKTTNHGYNVPDRGTRDWDRPLNENFERLDADMEIRDTEDRLGEYDPVPGAKFLATDTERVFLGDGTAWLPQQTTGTAPTFDALRLGQTFQDGFAANVVGGHPINTVEEGVRAATIAGGGASVDEEGDFPNVAGGDFAVIGGGVTNTADRGATVSGGTQNTASEEFATVGGGSSNTASGRFSAVGGGRFNDANDSFSTIGGGGNNRAGELYDTIGGGHSNTAEGEYATVPGGQDNTARGRNSFAAGRGAIAGHDGTFVWSAGGDLENPGRRFRSTGEDQFLIDAAGGVGIGTDDPATRLHVVGEQEDRPIAVIENTAEDEGPNVLDLRVGQRFGVPGTETDFIVFRDGSGNLLGEIQGDGAGGIRFRSAGADYAEFLPRVDPDEPLEPGDVVGVFDGAVTRKTADARRVMVVSTQSILLGNAPDGDDDRYEPIAFVGQVPVKVRGSVTTGDLIVASGREDGTGTAVGLDEWHPDEHGSVVGEAWETSRIDSSAVRPVVIAVGLDLSRIVPNPRAENAELRDRLANLEARIDELVTDRTGAGASVRTNAAAD